MEAGRRPAAQAEGYTPLRTGRYERKFLVEDMPAFQVEALIGMHPRMFYSPYPPRYVNNLYLDTPDLECYYDNLHGASRRRKVRVRWYGPLLGEIARPMLEVKARDGGVGSKQSWPLAGFCLDTRFCDREFRRVAARSDLPEVVWWNLRSLNAVLLNRYHRRYYASRDGRFRLTLDTGLTFYKINGVLGNMIVHRQVDHREVIVELKYEVAEELQAPRVAGFFPFRITRSSKYVQGMERVYF